MPRRANYGFDAPYALFAFAGAGAASLVVAIGALVVGSDRHLARIFGFYALFFLANAASFLYTTRRGKLRVWDDLLDALRLTGQERVLDMGCGRGAVLTGAAARLSTGRAVGVDLWSTHDQSGNAAPVTARNASLEGVRNRVWLTTGDMAALPFPDGAFDVVLSSLAIHNIPSKSGRAKAIAEAWRVLKPGGRLAIADIRSTRHYVETLRALGASDTSRRGLGWRFWYGNPFAATSLVTASKAPLPSPSLM